MPSSEGNENSQKKSGLISQKKTLQVQNTFFFLLEKKNTSAHFFLVHFVHRK